MAEDYDYEGDGYLDMDDGWIYVEDEFDIADELAEGQIPDPGYSGTNYEIDMEGFEYDFFAYWDDIEYADDAYWDYGLPNTDAESGNKRKRGTEASAILDKRKRSKTKQIDASIKDREAEPLLFCSREERNQSLKMEAPLVKDKPFAFMSDWRERFANADGDVPKNHIMPESMRRAAEAEDQDTPPKVRRAQGTEDDGDEDEGGDWEDEAEGEEGLDLDPEMLKTILRERLGAAGMDGMDEEAFMQTIRKMMSSEGDGDAAGDLANALLGKVTAEGGDEAVSGWLSQQGVSLEEEADDASSVATAELPQESRRTTRGQHETPPDSAVSVPENGRASSAQKMALHAGSPTASSKKRAADAEKPDKKSKKVKFDVPSSSPQPATAAADEDGDESHLSSEDPLASESTVKTRKAKAASSTSTANGGAKSRKRKAPAEEPEQQKPAAKKTRSRELQQLGVGSVAEVPSPAPPAKRTRSARAKGGK